MVGGPTLSLGFSFPLGGPWESGPIGSSASFAVNTDNSRANSEQSRRKNFITSANPTVVNRQDSQRRHRTPMKSERHERERDTDSDSVVTQFHDLFCTPQTVCHHILPQPDGLSQRSSLPIQIIVKTLDPYLMKVQLFVCWTSATTPKHIISKQSLFNN